MWEKKQPDWADLWPHNKAEAPSLARRGTRFFCCHWRYERPNPILGLRAIEASVASPLRDTSPIRGSRNVPNVLQKTPLICYKSRIDPECLDHRANTFIYFAHKSFDKYYFYTKEQPHPYFENTPSHHPYPHLVEL
jgi:hypothetical protein